MSMKTGAYGEDVLRPLGKSVLDQIEDERTSLKVKEARIDEIRQDVKSPVTVYAYAVVCVMCALLYGFGLATFNTFGEYFVPHYLTLAVGTPATKLVIDEIEKWGTLYFLFGCTTSCAIGPLLAGLLGNRNLTYANIVFFIVTNGFLIFGMEHGRKRILFAVRFCSGLSAYLWTIIGPSTMKENLPSRVYGRVISAFNFIIAIGLAMGYCIGYEFFGAHWRIVFAIPCCFEALRLAFFVLVPMSDPEWLARGGAGFEALKDNYRYFYGEVTAELLAKEMIEKRAVEQRIEELQRQTEGTSFFSKVDFLSAEYNFQFLVGLILSLLNQLTGMNVLTMFSTRIFNAAGMSNAKNWTVALGLVSSLGTLVPVFGIDMFGKRNLMIWGLAGQAVGLCIFLAGLAFNTGAVIFGGACFAMICYNLSLGGILFGYIAEFVPKNGIFLAALIQWVLGCTLIFKVEQLQKWIGISGVYLGAQISAVVGMMIFIACGVETTGKLPAAIKEEFQRTKRRIMPCF